MRILENELVKKYFRKGECSHPSGIYLCEEVNCMALRILKAMTDPVYYGDRVLKLSGCGHPAEGLADHTDATEPIYHPFTLKLPVQPPKPEGKVHVHKFICECGTERTKDSPAPSAPKEFNCKVCEKCNMPMPAWKYHTHVCDGEIRTPNDHCAFTICPHDKPVAPKMDSCQCDECKAYLHLSFCAVHNEPAYLKGKCDCKPSAEKCDCKCHKGISMCSFCFEKQCGHKAPLPNGGLSAEVDRVIDQISYLALQSEPIASELKKFVALVRKELK